MFHNCPNINPSSGRVKRLALMLHGIGANGFDFLEIVPQLDFDTFLPGTYCMAPNGIEPYQNQPDRYQWFEIEPLILSIIQKRLAVNIRIIQQAIDQQLETLKLTRQDLILIGFSQGTILALALALETHTPFNCIIGFSGVMVPPIAPKMIQPTPICLIHGQEDQVIDVSMMQQSATFLHEQKLPLETYIIPNLRHTIDAQGIEYAKNFIKKHNIY